MNLEFKAISTNGKGEAIKSTIPKQNFSSRKELRVVKFRCPQVEITIQQLRVLLQASASQEQYRRMLSRWVGLEGNCIQGVPKKGDRLLFYVSVPGFKLGVYENIRNLLKLVIKPLSQTMNFKKKSTAFLPQIVDKILWCIIKLSNNRIMTVRFKILMSKDMTYGYGVWVWRSLNKKKLRKKYCENNSWKKNCFIN